MDSAGIPWYSTGTVNVTQGSSNVAGVGTNWVNAGLKVGDIFTIDKSRLYQITKINSNTSLTLQEAYQGATGTSQVYFVIRNFAGTMQAQIAAQVSELVNKYESYIDTELKQIIGPAGPTSFPYRGTWATGRSYNGLDVVQYGNQLYMALYGHTSTSANAPGATGTAWKQLTFDAAFSATQAEIAAVANAGAKNMINITNLSSLTRNGITFTKNDDGSITLNGTATEQTFFNLNLRDNSLIEGGKSYILSSGTPMPEMLFFVLRRASEATTIVELRSGEKAKTFTANSTLSTFTYIAVANGATLNNFTFYPMLRDARIKDDTFVPYGMTNAVITKELLLKPTWIEITGGVKYSIKNGIINIVVLLSGDNIIPLTPNAWKHLCSVPSGCAPATQINVNGITRKKNGDLFGLVWCKAQTDGTLSLYSNESISSQTHNAVSLYLSYPI